MKGRPNPIIAYFVVDGGRILWPVDDSERSDYAEARSRARELADERDRSVQLCRRTTQPSSMPGIAPSVTFEHTTIQPTASVFKNPVGKL